MKQTKIKHYTSGEDPFDTTAQVSQVAREDHGLPSLGHQSSEVQRKVRRALAMRLPQPSASALLSQQAMAESLRESHLKSQYKKRYSRSRQDAPNPRPRPISLEAIFPTEGGRP